MSDYESDREHLKGECRTCERHVDSISQLEAEIARLKERANRAAAIAVVMPARGPEVVCAVQSIVAALRGEEA